jgi:ADP-ribose pyrophosphatase YjhB (NUDIX family)
VDVHHIQAKILKQLLYAEACSYAELRPDGVESNHFAYHLDQLLRQNSIVKEDRKYRLSTAGLSLVDKLSQQDMRHRSQPHIVTAVDLTNEAGETLLFTRNFQPYFHLAGFPLGKTHIEETVAQAAERELQEKTGLTGVPLVQRGLAYIEAKQQGITISKVLYHIFHAEVTGRPPTQTPAHRGTCAWADHTTYEPTELMPGFLKIKALLAQPGPLFFTEIVEELADER